MLRNQEGHSRKAKAVGVVLAVAVVSLITSPVRSDVTFSHDDDTVGVAAPPGNAVFTAPDVMDIFTSGAPLDSAPGANVGNSLLFDNLASFGLLKGDDVDAIHIERRQVRADINFRSHLLFSVDVGSLGGAGTDVASEAPTNAGDVFFTPGDGTNAISVDQTQIGLAAVASEDVDGLLVQSNEGIQKGTRLYFSLAAGSPSRAALSASAADVLPGVTGSGGPPPRPRGDGTPGRGGGRRRRARGRGGGVAGEAGGRGRARARLRRAPRRWA